ALRDRTPVCRATPPTHRYTLSLHDALPIFRRKIEASGALESSQEVIREGAAFTVTTRRRMPTDQVPASFRSLVGQSLDVRLVERSEEQRLNSSHVKISYAVFCLKKKILKSA